VLDVSTRTVSETWLGVRMPRELRDALDASADGNGRTTSGELRYALSRYLAGDTEKRIDPAGDGADAKADHGGQDARTG
jgi:hypothetical protein